jgi:hypothetical protein
MYSINYTDKTKSVDTTCNKNYIMVGHSNDTQLSVDCLVETSRWQPTDYWKQALLCNHQLVKGSGL